MNVRYYDTGILLKLYTNERESSPVRRYVINQGRVIVITDLHISEAISALRLKEFRHECSTEEATQAIACIHDDIHNRILRMTTLDWPSVWMRCQLLAQTESGRLGTRTMDSLHVASALTMNVSQFITSDSRQAALAKACGLKVINPARN